MTHVPYKGAGPGTMALVAGEVNMMMAGSSFVPLVQEGRLRALAVTGERRLPSLPEVPTFAELGYPAINVQTFALIVAPAGTPAAVVQRLNTAFADAIKLPETRAALEQRGQLPVGGTPAQAAAFIRDNQASLLKIVKDADIKLD
jgi:tripartite-type tricarboxylate transporter receptor subunit TctC